ncbi:hypothetical protein LCL98_22485 [Rossellomorea aquimaris]|nr:hypothetical protein [Rossellomorea aquimaris]
MLEAEIPKYEEIESTYRSYRKTVSYATAPLLPLLYLSIFQKIIPAMILIFIVIYFNFHDFKKFLIARENWRTIKQESKNT